MKRFLAFALVASLALPVAPAPAGDLPLSDGSTGRPEENVLFAGGGTNLTNGIFFPGAADCSADGCEPLLPPLQIARGSNIEFVNLDASFITNGHRIASFKRKMKGKKKGQPLFYSEQVDGPGTAVVKTSRLKPGLYYYTCTTHSPMFGAIEVVE